MYIAAVSLVFGPIRQLELSESFPMQSLFLKVVDGDTEIIGNQIVGRQGTFEN